MQETDLSDNPRFVRLRELLEAEGFSLRCLWQARTSRHDRSFRFPDVELYQVIGADSAPSVATFVVQDHGDDGISIWFDSHSARIEQDVRTIIDGGRGAQALDLLRELEDHCVVASGAQGEAHAAEGKELRGRIQALLAADKESGK